MQDSYIFKVKSNTSSMVFMDKNRFCITYGIDYLSHYPIDIELRNYDEEAYDCAGELIATISGIYFNIDSMRDNETSLFDTFDDIDQDVFNMYETLFDGEEYREEFEIMNENLFYLINITVEEKYRQQGMFTMLINQIDEIIKYIANLNVGVLVASTYCDNKKLHKKVESILIEAGFIIPSLYQDDYLVMELY